MTENKYFFAPDLRAPYFYILSGNHSCDNCSTPMTVYCFAAPPVALELVTVDDGHLEFESDEAYESWVESPEPLEWKRVPLPYLIIAPEALNAGVASLLPVYAPSLKRAATDELDSLICWRNQCPSCEHLQSDIELEHGGSAFLPNSEEDLGRIGILRVSSPLAVRGGSRIMDLTFFDSSLLP